MEPPSATQAFAATLNRANEENDRLRRTIKALELETTTLKEVNAAQAEEIARLEAEQSTSENELLLQGQVERMRSEQTEREADLARLTSEYDTLRGSFDQLDKELPTLRSAVAQVAELQQKNAELTSAVKTAEAHAQALRGQNALFAKEKADLATAAEAFREQLERTQAEATSRLEPATKSLHQREHEMAILDAVRQREEKVAEREEKKTLRTNVNFLYKNALK